MKKLFNPFKIHLPEFDNSKIRKKLERHLLCKINQLLYFPLHNIFNSLLH